MVRLNKYLSEAGICSRREADRLIQAGRVTVDGRKAVPGMQVEEGQQVRVGKKLIAGREKKVVLAFYKPAGIVCTEDKRERKSTARYLDYPVRVTYAGRLDKDSEGLLIMTNDGELINRMMRARYFHEKEYRVTVDRPLVEKIGKYTFRIVLTQGLNRQIRRMCQVFGYQVEKLVRVRIININLGSLKPGAYRTLTEEEVRGLYEQTETKTDAGVGRTSQ